MKRIIKQILIVALFAVAMLGGGEVPILHAPQFAEAHAFAHKQLHDALGGVYHTHAAPDATHDHHEHDGDEDQPPGSDRACMHVHAHCCTTVAILAAAAEPIPVVILGQQPVERNDALPYGQLAHPPRRPPRPAA